MASWSMYEPVDSVTNIGGSMAQVPGQMAAPQMQNRNEHVAQPMQQIPHQMGPPPSKKGTGTVPVPQPTPPKTLWEDISDFYEIGDWSYLLTAALVIEILVIAITRFFPGFSGKYLNLWYSRFRMSAVIADIASVLIGFGIARYLYTEFIYPNKDWNPVYFTGTALGVQILHDILFYLGVIKPLPDGRNGMIDVMKSYSEVGGSMAIVGDSAIMIGTSVVSMLLKASAPHIVIAVALVSAYALPYILEVKNEFSGLS